MGQQNKLSSVQQPQQQLIGQHNNLSSMQQQQSGKQQQLHGSQSDSTALTGNSNGGDWQEEVYRKIKAMKDLYLLDLTNMHQDTLGKLPQYDSLPQQPKNNQLDKLKMFKNMLERYIRLLQLPNKHNILANYKDKLGTYEKKIIQVINSHRRKAGGPQQQAQALPPAHMQSMQKSQQTHSQLTQVQSHDTQMNMQGSMAAMQPNNMGNLQQSTALSLSGGSNVQQNMMNSIQPTSNLESGQNTSMNSLHQVSSGSLQQNTVSGPQQVNINPKSLQPNTNMLQLQHIKQEQLLQSQQLKQFHQRQMQQQFLHKQQFMQQQQFHQLTKQQESNRQMQGNQLSQLHQKNDSGDIKLLQQMGVKSGAFQQQQLHGSQSDSTALTGNSNGGDWQEEVYRKIKAMKDLYLLDLTNMHQDILGKLPQYDSLPQQPKNDQLDKLKMFKSMLERYIQLLQLPNKHNILANYKDKLGTYEKKIIQVINSHRRKRRGPQQQAQALPPAHMQSMQQSHDTQMDIKGSIAAMQPNNMGNLQQSTAPSLSGGSNVQQNMMNSIQPTSNLESGQNTSMNSLHQVSSGSLQQTIVSGPQQININPMSLQPNTNMLQPQHIKQEQLLQSQQLKQFQQCQMQQQFEQVKSMLPKDLSASVSDIGSVVSMTDRITGSAPGNGSRAAVGEDLVAMTKCRLQARKFVTQDGTNGTRKMKRFTHLNTSETPELDLTASSTNKKPRTESNPLLEEIKEINRGLIDTVVSIPEEDVDPAAASAVSEGGDGTIITCSFSAVALGPNLKSQYASAQMSPIQPLRLFVPANYPNCSPILLDKFPAEVSKEFEDISTKTKSRFSVSLSSLQQPMSLKDIARTWDACAAAVMSEYA
ncbi:hypothetical protein M8C21_009891 [Ambrosia artemisiifolia]|uniref:ARC105/Med15 mediator subunit C-terminal domain-containing protein n=1 Tax=Ambrosia artemisiifolia TaxID=4212 RepID=A0AAD5GYA2_AMBAR|nr:hypothetical protein M8C21_009891 [Ambrosia artemisiifolia]